MSGTVTDRRAFARNCQTFQGNRAWDKVIAGIGDRLAEMAAGSPFDEHHIPETSSDQRMHLMARNCWCSPDTQHVPWMFGVAVLHKAEQ